jgi:hypothetical protein
MEAATGSAEIRRMMLDGSGTNCVENVPGDPPLPPPRLKELAPSDRLSELDRMRI